jgi:translation initiation factor IF-1
MVGETWHQGGNNNIDNTVQYAGTAGTVRLQCTNILGPKGHVDESASNNKKHNEVSQQRRQSVVVCEICGPTKGQLMRQEPKDVINISQWPLEKVISRMPLYFCRWGPWPIGAQTLTLQ